MIKIAYKTYLEEFMKKAMSFILWSASLVWWVAACSSAPKIERTEVEKKIDLSGKWNDIDSQMVSKEMIKDCLARPWLRDFIDKHETKPRIIVGKVVNKSHEHISIETFTKDLERTLINSGQIKFVADKKQRQEIRGERSDQAESARTDTVKQSGKEYGADYILKGQINTIMDAAGKYQVRYYQTELELIHLESNEKVWIGQKKIKKLLKYRKAKL